MPAPTKLDKLAQIFKSTGNTAPFRGMRIRGEFNDPLNYTIRQRISMEGAPELAYMAVPQNGVGREIKLTPEREVYQKGIAARMQPKYLKADEDVSDAYDVMASYNDEWREAVEEAKSDMAEDWTSTLDYQDFEDVDPNYLEVDAPSTNLREYWPIFARTPEAIGEDFDAAQDRYYAAKDVQSGLRRPEAWMQEQTMTPRYRNYQRAMRQRQENAQIGSLNAAIMNLYRQGYSMPEIREILRNRRIR